MSGEARALLHLGIYPTNGMLPAFDLHTDPEVEYEVLLDLGEFPSVSGWVSGSWACWGPADQATDGDRSLHLVLDVTDIMIVIGNVYQAVKIWLDKLILAIEPGLPQHCRLLDFGVMTTEDHSEVRAMVALTPSTHRHIYGVEDAIF